MNEQIQKLRLEAETLKEKIKKIKEEKKRCQFKKRGKRSTCSIGQK